VIGHQLYGTEGLMKSVTYYPVDDVYKIEGGVRHGTAVLAKEGIAVFDNAIGRGVIGGWGDSYINETVEGDCISMFDTKKWEEVVTRRVGKGREQGNFSKIFVPSPLVEPAMDETDYSSTGYFKKENFAQDLDVNNERLFPRLRKGPMFVGVSYLNYAYGIHKVHQHTRIPAGDTSILIRRKMARFNNIISADSVRRYSGQAKAWVVDKSHTLWGNIGQNVRLYVSSELALNDGSTQDSAYHNPEESGTYSY